MDNPPVPKKYHLPETLLLGPRNIELLYAAPSPSPILAESHLCPGTPLAAAFSSSAKYLAKRPPTALLAKNNPTELP
ncbi:Protein of unknown function [Pyronema omphalodes CBS 100304]|uniref:Uncharacterized protein n=1 Tax=Pyronema omphalodes (strain CBS 100304) TaxID=1076935 RepID=U4LQT1_PYROM|nr:Protein of unknown function [Pyronema omphalodes CBS 100304]